MTNVLVVGGAGYVGSHVCKALKAKGFVPIVFDNLSHGHLWAARYGPFVLGDLHRPGDIETALQTHKPLAVIHMASSIHVRESVANPHKTYHNNVAGTLSLLKALVSHGPSLLVFSSTASIYGAPLSVPIDESHLKDPLSPYGKSKWMIEQLLEDFEKAHGLRYLALRYFNAAGADPEGEIGEAHDPETHLIPLAVQTALGEHPVFTIHGTSHPTADGTAVRDFVHVCDLADAHIQGLLWLAAEGTSLQLNLGTGQGYSVKQVIAEVEKQSGKRLSVRIGNHSAADPPVLVANAEKAKKLLQWQPRYSTLESLVETAWNWHKAFILSNLIKV
jgi:UDP-arabinose 4-epimerase